MLNKRTSLWLAVAWLFIVLLVSLHQWKFWHEARLDTDVLALLPENEHIPAVNAATRKLTDAVASQIVLLVGASDWQAARTAADAAKASLQSSALDPLAVDAKKVSGVIDFYRPWRDRLLTAAQREQLGKTTPEQSGGSALLQLYQPNSAKITEWREDPLGLWPAWWTARAAESQVRPRDGYLSLSAEGRDWILLSYQSRHAGLSLNTDELLTTAVRQAREAAMHAVPGARVLAAGVPLYAEAASAQANNEMNTIGYGSLVAVLILVWLCFRSLAPIVLVGLSLLIGCGVALSVTALVFDRVHLITLVFGASLVGVAEDYGIHYFCARQGHPVGERWAILQNLLPGLVLALVTSIVAYLALGFAPFPGLRQMAIFSAVGLTAAFLTVLCWFPLFDRGRLPVTPFTLRFADSLQRWPRWESSRYRWPMAVLLGIFIAGGLSKLSSRDDVRQLQSAPAALIADQKELGRLLKMPSPAQFFLIEGKDAEEVLRREEALKPRLDVMVAEGVVPGYRALSDWVPSAERQLADAKLTAQVETGAISMAAKKIGEAPERAHFANEPLTLSRWLAGPAAPAMQAQWLGKLGSQYYSVILMQSLTPAMLPRLESASQGLPGIRWVDKTAEISALMGRYRLVMGGLLLAGYVGVFLALAWRFRRSAWRALLPTVLGSLMTVAAFGFAGEPIQLFSVLAFVLLLGMGVDYGIFLLEHPGDNSTWVSVALAGVSTLLSFGLLALSGTPALRAFGLTMLSGEVLIWILTPYFRPPDAGVPHLEKKQDQ